MIHSFDEDDAVKFGINAAIILSNLKFWIKKNEANERHFYQGKYWTYNSVIAFTKLMPYLSQKQIRTAIDILIDRSVIICDNFNTSTYDQTKWYALKVTLHLPYRANENAPQGKSSVNTVVNTDSKLSQQNSDSKEILSYLNEKSFKNFQPTDSNLKLITARLKEGATKKDCIIVINSKVQEWISDPKMNQYLRPATLFNATKFSQYVGSISSEDDVNPFRVSNIKNQGRSE